MVVFLHPDILGPIDVNVWRELVVCTCDVVSVEPSCYEASLKMTTIDVLVQPASSTTDRLIDKYAYCVGRKQTISKNTLVTETC